MDDIYRLGNRMKADWDRRISHDYRFWMSDGYKSDAEMWETGRRDFSLLLGDLANTNSKTLLEIGCGVGRMLRPALGAFERVIGIDVSDEAIKRAHELLGVREDLVLHAGNGIDLRPIPDGSVDVTFSFAALTSIPTPVIACYLVECWRVLNADGLLRLQVYLGSETPVHTDDTLHLRCFSEERFLAAATAAGFTLEWIRELVLPFEVSLKDAGIVAMLVSLRKTAATPRAAQDIAQLLLPGGEDQADTQMTSELESWMSINYAKQLLSEGRLAEAERTLQYALSVSKAHAIDIRDLLDQIASIAGVTPEQNWDAENLEVLQKRFPDVATALREISTEDVAVSQSPDGPVLSVQGVCLDHLEKPKSAAQVWVKRLLSEPRVREADRLTVFGFGAGYHIEELLHQCTKEVAVIEPSPSVLLCALRSRDLRVVIEKIAFLAVGDVDASRHGGELCLRAQSQAIAPDQAQRLRRDTLRTHALTSLHPSLAILGPLQGGTLPITGYCGRGLSALKQRVRVLDMSGFAPGYHFVNELTKDKIRQVICQNRYLEFLSHVIMESAQEKPFDILICMAQAPISQKVLTDLRAQGVITVLWFVEDYLRFTYWRDFAKYFDFVFTIQDGPCLEAVKRAGAGEVHYLPTACDPSIHAPCVLTPEERQRWGSPVSFVGAGYHNRQQMFASLAHLPFKIWGTEWPECRPFDRLVQEGARRLTPDEYVKIFNATDININLHSSTERDGVDPTGDFVNPRTFELAAAGAFQLVDERSLLPACFEPGRDVVTFRNTEDLKEKISYFLEHPEERRPFIERARKRALEEHTYAHRLQEMLRIVYSARFEQLKGREDHRPWKKMLERSSRHPELRERCQAAFERGEEPKLDPLVSDIVMGKGKLSETEQKLLFLFHVRKQMITMRAEEGA